MITCMPASAAIFHHTRPLFTSLGSRFYSKFSRSCSKNISSHDFIYGNSISNQFGNRNGTMRGFIEMTTSQVSKSESIMASVRPVKTIISGGRKGPVDEDGVYLKHELRQESQFYTEPGRNVDHDRSLGMPINIV